MIKFFRRIRQSLLSENKFSKYLFYAIGEIVLVVIGILIALQVNNNNERRKANLLEQQYLQQLLQDFKQNKQVIGYYKEEYDRCIKYLDVTLRHTGPNVSAPTKAVFDSIQSINTPNVELLYATETANSGLDLEILTNNSLKQFIKALTITYKQYDINENDLNKLMLEQRKKHQQYIPLIADEPKYTQQHFKADTIGFLRDKEFQNITVDRLWVTQSAQYALEGVERHNDSIISLLERELKTFNQ